MANRKKQDDNANWLVVIIVVVVVLTLANYFGLFGKNKNKTEQQVIPPLQPEPKPVPPAPTPVPVPQSTQISKGSRGEDVKAIQQALNTYNGEKLTADGIWGNNTQAAIERAGLPSIIKKSEVSAYIAQIQQKGSSNNNLPPAPQPPPKPIVQQMVKNGTRNAEITKIQRALNWMGENLVEDSIYGNKTAAALQKQGFNTEIPISELSKTAAQVERKAAGNLAKFVTAKNETAARNIFKRIRNRDAYFAMRDRYITELSNQTGNAVTPVTHLLRTFTNSAAYWNGEFKRVGLKQATDGTWS